MLGGGGGSCCNAPINGLPQEVMGGGGGVGGQSTENLTFSGFQMGAAAMD